VEELHPELALEVADRLGQRRLRDEALLGGGGERAGLDHGERVAELLQFHASILSIGCAYRIQRNLVLDSSQWFVVR